MAATCATQVKAFAPCSPHTGLAQLVCALPDHPCTPPSSPSSPTLLCLPVCLSAASLYWLACPAPTTVTFDDTNESRQVHLYQEEYRFLNEDGAGESHLGGGREGVPLLGSASLC